MILNLLHIVNDEKFIDAAWSQFEAVSPNSNTYILPRKEVPIENIKNVVPRRVSKFSFLNPVFIKSLEKYDAVILHSMTDFALELIARSGDKVNFIWIGMGFDYYDLLYKDPYRMLEPDTAILTNELLPSFGFKKSANPFVRFLKSVICPNSNRKETLIQKVKLFCPVLPSESAEIKAKIGQFQPKTVSWNYGVLSSLVDNNSDPSWVSGNNILVGNSATPTNNHIEVFKNLKCLKLPEETKIVVPLSYGSAPYRCKIIELGYQLFGRKFYPITDFLKFEEYVLLLKDCSLMIMNHKRQQGAGNIGIGVYFGAKVFLNPTSPLYDYYRNMGATIFTLSNLEESVSEGIIGLPPDSAQVNRQIIRRERGKEANLLRTKELIAEIKNISKHK